LLERGTAAFLFKHLAFDCGGTLRFLPPQPLLLRLLLFNNAALSGFDGREVELLCHPF